MRVVSTSMWALIVLILPIVSWAQDCPQNNPLCLASNDRNWWQDRLLPDNVTAEDVFNETDVLHLELGEEGFYPNRPGHLGSRFYDNQGIKTETGLSVGPAFLVADVYLDADWITPKAMTLVDSHDTGEFVRFGLWGGTFDEDNSATGYPIIAFTNVEGDEGQGGRIEVWDDVLGGYTPVDAQLNYDGWNNLEIHFTGTSYVFRVNGEDVYTFEERESDTATDSLAQIYLNASNNGVAGYDVYYNDVIAGLLFDSGQVIEDQVIEHTSLVVRQGAIVSGGVIFNDRVIVDAAALNVHSGAVFNDGLLLRDGSTLSGIVNSAPTIQGNISFTDLTLSSPLAIDTAVNLTVTDSTLVAGASPTFTVNLTSQQVDLTLGDGAVATSNNGTLLLVDRDQSGDGVVNLLLGDGSISSGNVVDLDTRSENGGTYVTLAAGAEWSGLMQGVRSFVTEGGGSATFVPGSEVGDVSGDDTDLTFTGTVTIAGNVSGNNNSYQFAEDDDSDTVINGDLNLGTGSTTRGGTKNKPVNVMGNAVVSQGSVLGGNISVGGNLEISGQFQPGNSPGILSIGGNFLANSDTYGVIEIDLSAPVQEAGVTHDVVAVGGNIVSGTHIPIDLVNLGNAGPTKLSPGDAVVFSASNDLNGMFRQTSRVQVGPYDYELLTNGGEVSVVSYESDEFTGASTMLNALVQSSQLMTDLSNSVANRIWVHGTRASLDTSNAAIDYDQEVHFRQAGIEFELSRGFSIGAFSSHSESDIDQVGHGGDVPISGAIESVAGYSKLRVGNFNANFLYSQYESDWNMIESVWHDASKIDIDGHLSTLLMGYRFPLVRGMSLTPWAEGSYQTIEEKDPVAGRTLPDNITIGRVGLKFGTHSRKLDTYLNVGMVSDFGATDDIEWSSISLPVEPYDTALELDVGFNYQISRYIHMYTDFGWIGGEASGYSSTFGIEGRW